MFYKHLEPSADLSRLIKSYWIVDSESDSTSSVQKIIPDGYPELIFHYGQPYKIKLSNEWKLQSKTVLAGQIRNHFYLKNLGRSGMIGVKLMPTTLYKLYGINMSDLTDQVVNPMDLNNPISELLSIEKPELEHRNKFIASIALAITNRLDSSNSEPDKTDLAVEHILKSKGSVSITSLCDDIDISERQLERQFLRQVGLSPKFYARIIRFSYIFELIQQNDQSWSDIVYQSGFYDQSHFIKNFKEFTGEDPSVYGFNEKNMANFHLKK